MIDVTPPYLAGFQYTGWVFEHLVREWAWGRSTDDDLGQTFAWSNDHRFRIADRQLDPGAAWRITAAKEPLGPPDWMAGFSENTPPEIIMAITEPLARTGSAIDWTGDSHPALRTPTDRRALIRTLQDAGWRSTLREGTLDLEAPDQLARVQLRLDPPGEPQDLMGRPHLYVEIGPRGNGGYPPYWQAMFTTTAPTVAVDALAHALTDPTPLRRDREWMDEELLEHLGQRAEDAPAELRAEVPALGTTARSYTEDDLRWAAAEVCEQALDQTEDLDLVPEIYLENQVVPSSRSGTATTWGELPEEQRELANLLVTDLVVGAAGQAPILFDLVLGPDFDPRTASKHPTPPITTPLRELAFTNDDLHSAAGIVAASQIAWVDPSGLADSMHDLPIYSTTNDGIARSWGSLPEEEYEQALRDVQKLLDQAGDRTARLFTPPSRPTPLALVGPAYLAGPGHDQGAAAKPLLDNGWKVERDAGTTVYTRPCRRLRAEADTDSTGTTWTTSAHYLVSGGEIWRATADSRTPLEIVTALHAALATSLATSPGELFRPTNPSTLGLAPLIAGGWHDAYSGPHHISWTAPGTEMASVTRSTDPARLAAGENPEWIVSGGTLGPGTKEGWYLQMSEHIPAPLLKAVADGLVDSTPVARLGRDLTSEHLVYLDVRPLDTRRPSGTSERRLAARARSLPAAHRAPEPEVHETSVERSGRLRQPSR
ncbi:DUF317 domain-containing protein [Kitasatospora sp. NPDC098663]|uniref:DUF317 domain-containing protein n=1 Tax=Kitasatospora sp. NPDC098663 TaxID=3364096 RepID=UPI00382DE46A